MLWFHIKYIYIYIATQIVENCAFIASGTKDSANDQSKQPRIAKEILNGVIFAQQIKILNKIFCTSLDRLG